MSRLAPSQFDRPWGVARRVIASKAPAGLFAILLAGLGVLATPVDRALVRGERTRYRNAPAPSKPILFVCGPARSGTTLVALSLMRALDVSYLTNLTSIFPLAPVTASRFLRAAPQQRHVPLASYYGRTAGFRAPNDGLHLWDRWLGDDRSQVTDYIGGADTEAMVSFFGAYEEWTTRPLVAKNNALDAHASLVADRLPTARFLCLTRDPVFLGQSLLIARREIHGDDGKPYGLDHPAPSPPLPLYDDIARQVVYHERLARSQQQSLGPERFQMVAYEEFCAAPRILVAKLAAEMSVTADVDRLPERFEPSRRMRLSAAEFAALEEAIATRETE